MLSRTLPTLMLGLVAPLLGCQGPDITGELNTYETLLGDINGRLCECPENFGFDSLSECFDALGGVGTDERLCVEDALDGHHADGQDYLVCANAALQGYEQCLVNNVDCDPDANSACLSVYTVELSRCTQLPAKVQVAVTACTG
jgi:hypothetical protein